MVKLKENLLSISNFQKMKKKLLIQMLGIVVIRCPQTESWVVIREFSIALVLSVTVPVKHLKLIQSSDFLMDSIPH